MEEVVVSNFPSCTLTTPTRSHISTLAANDCTIKELTRPRWATFHPDNWTVLEVAEWLAHVAEAYSLNHQVKLTLVKNFSDVNGLRLRAMTLKDYNDLEPRHGNLLYFVFRDIVSAGNIDQPDERSQPRTLPSIREDDPRCSLQFQGYRSQDTASARGSHSWHGHTTPPQAQRGFPDLPYEQTKESKRYRSHHRESGPPSP